MFKSLALLVISAMGMDETLRWKLQAELDLIAKETKKGFIFGLIDSEGNDFALGAGPRTPIDSKSYFPGTLDHTDMMNVGSGTKAYTATAVMQLVDQEKIKLLDPAHVHIDPSMSR
jgi:CubicO group peptidase (beta-lactamase class C family)